MALRLFVTGASGFVGQRLLPALLDRGHAIVALDRSGALANAHPASPRLQIITGDLLDTNSYLDALPQTDVVLHLAASTGRASAADHMRVNLEGTRRLVDACRGANAPRLLFVSSIAATFPLEDYPYAAAKAQAEQVVRASGLRFAILRPTLIMGAGSPVEAALAKLAQMPAIPIFGAGRSRVQPIAVDDVVRLLIDVAERDLFDGGVFDAGGPDVLSIEELLQRIRHARGGARGRVIHLPMPVVLAGLRLAGAIGAGGLLPMTIGQLSAFRYDSVAGANALFDHHRAQLAGVDRMLGPLNPADASDASARVECTAFTRYLLGQTPTPYVVRKYLDAVAPRPVPQTDRFGRLLIRFARVHPICTGMADGYARFFLRGAALRHRLVLLLAILETCPPSHRQIDDAIGRGAVATLATLGWRTSTAIVSLILATLLLSPVRAGLAVAARLAR